MNMIASSLPTFKDMPVRIALESLAGYLYGRIVKVNPIVTMTICAIRGLAETCLYQIANYLFGDDEIRAHKIYIATSVPINMIFIIVLKELNLIGHLSSCVLSLGVVGLMVIRVQHIQKLEEGELV